MKRHVLRVFCVALWVGCSALSAQTDGQLDSAFGEGGKASAVFSATVSVATTLALQPDGKVLLGGYTLKEHPKGDFALVRMLPHGALDTDFGTDGRVVTDFDQAHDEILRVFVLDDGRILAAGRSDDRMALARYGPEGGLDPAFGVQGIQTYCPTSSPCFPADFALGQGGVLWAALRLDDKAYLLRFLPDGSLDPAWTAFEPIDYGPANHSLLERIAPTPDGGVVCAGRVVDAFWNDRPFLLRYKADGSLDQDFADPLADAYTPMIGHRCVALHYAEADDRIWLLMQGGDQMDRIHCLGGDGAPRADFGQQGIAELALPAGNFTTDMVVDAAGRPLVSSMISGWPGQTCIVRRFTPQGQPDVSFGNNGVCAFTYGPLSNQLYALALQPDGKVLAAGTSYILEPSLGGKYRFTLTRLLAGISRTQEPWAMPRSWSAALEPNLAAVGGVLRLRIVSEETAELQIELLDALGRAQGAMLALRCMPGEHTLELPLRHVRPGLGLVRIRGGGGVQSLRFVAY